MILGVLDIIVGAILCFASGSPFTGNGFVLFFTIIFFLKGLWSFLSSVSAGFFFDIMGILDLLSAILLLLSYIGIAHVFLLFIGIIMVFKGLYSIAIGFPTAH